ncbi:MAG: hypothetical protein ACRCWG_04805 [Sarcina sp.]
MKNELLKLKNTLESNTSNFDIDKKLLKFSLINSDSAIAFSEFYNFEDNNEIISFLKNVIIPSAAISILTEDNGQLVVTIEDSREFLKQLGSYGAEEKLVKNCSDIYRKLSKIDNKTTEKDFAKVIDFINFELSEGTMIVLSVEYANNTKQYLKNIYNEYEEMDHLDILEKELARINLCIGGFLDICENTEKYKNEIKEKLLDRLPY